MTRLELPSSGWAELRDPAEKITARQRKAIILAGEQGDTWAEQSWNLTEAVMAFAVTAWSFGPLPSENIDVIGDLDTADYDELVDATSVYQERLLPSKKREHPLDPKAEDSSFAS